MSTIDTRGPYLTIKTIPITFDPPPKPQEVDWDYAEEFMDRARAAGVHEDIEIVRDLSDWHPQYRYYDPGRVLRGLSDWKDGHHRIWINPRQKSMYDANHTAWHEVTHMLQREAEGPRFDAMYVWAEGVYGYFANPYERDANFTAPILRRRHGDLVVPA